MASARLLIACVSAASPSVGPIGMVSGGAGGRVRVTTMRLSVHRSHRAGTSAPSAVPIASSVLSLGTDLPLNALWAAGTEIVLPERATIVLIEGQPAARQILRSSAVTGDTSIA